MLRVWNPGRNEPREQREGEEAEIVETLIEVEESEVEVPVAVGAAAMTVTHGAGRRRSTVRPFPA